ncbi:hypothetical protein Taro_045859 [Colocasia esculenta]|uniref:POX domain-containing protein n=1 Tax=Colocasia esculenta TaxID=4460 RepID=A0A843X124_COLES|nr:hypothetical protein [Colocasia esculenta]
MDSNPHQMQHGLEPSCNLFSPPQSGVANAGWKAFSCRPPDKPCSSSSTSSKAVMQEPSADNFYRPDALLEAAQGDETLMVTPELAAWQVGRSLVDDSSLRCLLPGPAIEQPSQRLSLSLRKTKSSDSRLQQEPPFGLREGMRQRSNLRDYGLFPRTSFHGELQQQQLQSLLQECQFFPQLGTASSSSGFCSNPHQYLRNSQYLAPVQELLDEFCSLKPSSNNINERPNNKPRRQLEEGVSPSSCAGQRHRLLLSSDIMELKKRMAKLVSMLEELDRRYRMYCEQMKALVSSFEAAAGDGAARVYSTLASKAMSRHFRCLRDGIVGQISETKNAIGEKDPVTAPGMTRGETPRLRLLVRYIRQQKEFQYAGVMETHPWRPQRGLPERSVSVLRAWLFEHFLHPYPSDVDKHILARQTGLSRSQARPYLEPNPLAPPPLLSLIFNLKTRNDI